MLLHIWSGCGALLNGVAVADTKPCRRGDAPYRALSRSTSSTLCRDAWRPCCCANWTRPALQCFPVPVCGRAVCDPHGIPPSDGVWTRETRVEGRRRPKKAEVADVVAICVQTSYRPIVVVLIPQRRDALTNSIMKGIAWLKKCLAHPSLLPLSAPLGRAESS